MHIQSASEFEAWFSQSKLVDSDGDPLQLYHGTAEAFEEFKLSPTGNFGAGIYLTTSADAAAEFACGDGANIRPVFVRMARPFYTDASWEFGEQFDFDSPACQLIVDLFSRPKALKMFRDAKETHWGAVVRNKLLQLGHDGVVARWSDGSLDVVALNAFQVCPAIGALRGFASRRQSPALI